MTLTAESVSSYREALLFRHDRCVLMDLQEIGCVSVDWLYLAQDRIESRILLKVVLNIHSDSIKSK